MKIFFKTIMTINLILFDFFFKQTNFHNNVVQLNVEKFNFDVANIFFVIDRKIKFDAKIIEFLLILHLDV